MAWVKERTTSDGVKRYVACYRDPEGRQRSAGTFSSKRAAERAGNREEQRVLAGSWRDHSLGEVRFREYVEDEWLPSKHIEPTTKAAYESNLDQALLPVLRSQAAAPDHPRPGAGLGHQGRRRRAVGAVDPQVPHHAALDLRPRGPRRADRGQPLCAHRAAQGDRHEDPHPDARASSTS